jgi:hypothetical protein
LLEREHIRRVYVRPLVNNTYKPGVQNVVYNALIRTLLQHRRVHLAKRIEDADAVLDGAIGAAEVGSAGATSAGGLSPSGVGPGDGPPITTIYNATLTCTFSLSRTESSSKTFPPRPPSGRIGPLTEAEAKEAALHEGSIRLPRTGSLWAQSFSRAKPFLAANQLDVPGTTSALINESEFDRALADLAVSMMDDLHESMLAMF